MTIERNFTELLNTEQAARFLGLSASMLAKARVTGSPSIPFTKLGAAVRYRLSDLENYVSSNIRRSTSQSNEK